MITLEVLNASLGERTITIQDEDPAQRQKLAVQVQELIRQGFLVFLTTAGNHQAEPTRIQGYDASSNEWILTPGRQGAENAPALPATVPATGTTLTTVAPASGG